MKEILKIPPKFWSLFHSGNRYIYMESLMAIYDEYLYNDYFLTRETCITIIAEHFADRTVDISADDDDLDKDVMEPMATKIISKLLRFAWLKKVEDYSSFKTNIVIPDYASMFIEVFKKLANPDSNDTDLYIQNVYTNIYSFYHDGKAGIELLKAAMANTTRLNRALQDMLHNMDRFFAALLEKENYEDLLSEHLNVYVEAIINRKYSILKTSDNFYIYKNDIKKLLRTIQEDENRLYLLKQRHEAEGKKEEAIETEFEEIIYEIERGILNMEERISHIDTEHNKYVRATVSRLEYLLGNDDGLKGNVVTLLNLLSGGTGSGLLSRISGALQINDHTVVSSESLYKKRGKRRVFEDTVEVEEELEEELSRDDILRINRNKNRYSQSRIEAFVLDRMENGRYRTKDHPVCTEEEFDLLVLAYDYSIRKKSPFRVEVSDQMSGTIENEKYVYPDVVFVRKEKTEHVPIL